jgi:xanthosine utilization system XapX-like protein
MPDTTTQVTLVAFPMWTVYVVIALHVALVLLIGVVVFKGYGILQHVDETIQGIDGTIQDARKEVMPPVVATLKNVKTMSDDAARTTHNVTNAADRVSNVVSSVAARVESPAVKAAGLLSGIIAGARAAKGKGSDEPKKKGGKRGLFR